AATRSFRTQRLLLNYPLIWSQRPEFESRSSGLSAPQVPGVLDRPRSVVFTQVGAINRVPHTVAPRSHGTDRNLTIRDLDSTARFLEKSPVPAVRLDAPRSHEDAIVHHDNPNADEAVRPGSGSDAQAFALAELSQDV